MRTATPRSSDLFASFVDALLFQAAKEPNSPAIGTENGILTFGQLADAIFAATAHCRAAGLQPGPPVGLIISDPVWHVCLIAALYRLGIPSVSLSLDDGPAAATLDLAALLHDGNVPKGCPARSILVEPRWFTSPQGATPPTGGVFAASDLCRIALSSGTTGEPKPIAMSPQIIWDRLITYSLRGSFAASERIYCGPQLHSHFAFAIVFSALAYGKMVAFSANAEAALTVMSYFKIDLAILSVYQLSRLVDLQEKNYGGLSGLREIQAGGSLITDALLQRANARFGARIVSAYASTEAGTSAIAPMQVLRAGPGESAVGFVTPWTWIDVCNDEDAVLPRGDEGNIRIRSLGMAPAHRGGVTTVTSPDAFFPGDIGRVLENGMLVINGRANELINIGGNKIAPERFESIILGCPGVKDAAVFTVDIQSALPQIWAAIVADPGVNIGEIVKRCADTPTIGAPAVIKIVSSIPRNSTGKVMRQQLRRQLCNSSP